jgi:hypothetical protein
MRELGQAKAKRKIYTYSNMAAAAPKAPAVRAHFQSRDNGMAEIRRGAMALRRRW